MQKGAQALLPWLVKQPESCGRLMAVLDEINDKYGRVMRQVASLARARGVGDAPRYD